MTKNSVILAMLEPDINPQEVVDHAAWLAKVTGSDLHLILCDADTFPHGFLVSNEARDIAANIKVAREDMLNDFALPLRARGLTVKTKVVAERPIAGGIINHALEINPLYVVKGTQYHSHAQRAVFVDTDWQLIRGCPYPLWLVKPGQIGDAPVIIAAVDPMHKDDKAGRLDQLIIEHAKNIAEKANGEVHLLHTYQPLVGIGAEANKTFKPIKLPIDELSERIGREHREKLDGLASANGIDKKKTHQLPGDARDVLPFFARENKADLIVMGALARGGLKHKAIGSTAEKVLDDLHCDILIVSTEQ